MKRLLVLCWLVGTVFAQGEISAGRQVYIDLLQKKGLSPVEGISTQNLMVKLNGKPVKLLAATREATHPKVAIVVDASGSMAVNKILWDGTFQAAEKAIQNLSGDADVSLAVFGDKVTVFVSAKEGTQAEMQKLQDSYDGKDLRIGHGRTQLWDAISTAASMSRLGPGDALIVVTDGGDNNSHVSQHDLEKQLRLSKVRLYGVLLTRANPPTPEEESGPVGFREISETTGGLSLLLENDKSKEIKEAVDALTSSITKPCVLRVDMAASASGKLSVAYVNGSGKPNKGVLVTAPRYLAPEPESSISVQ